MSPASPFYKPRILDHLLKQKLDSLGAVLIEGPKACGKTTTSEQMAASTLYLGLSEIRKTTQELVAINPSAVLAGPTPKLIDEWQVIPQLWDDIRFEVDHRHQAGQFILTGSAVPADRSEIFHTGTGRFAWLKMRTMSLFESGESNGQVSLSDLFAGQKDIVSSNPLNIEQVAFATCRGGWPLAVDQSNDAALNHAYDYVESVINTDISRVDGVSRNKERVRQLLHSYARNLGSQAPLSSLRADVTTNATDAFSEVTCLSYLDALREIFVIEEMDAWNPNLRSKTAIRTKATRYFSDPSIGAAALGIGPQDLLVDPKTFGFLFENLCMRDLRIYASALNGDVYHYRDKNNLECDAVLHRHNGSYGLIEIKLGGNEAIEHGAATLQALAKKMDPGKMPAPSFLMVLVGVGPFAYRRKDGVFVVPIGCLKP